jgi:hypothetical protein
MKPGYQVVISSSVGSRDGMSLELVGADGERVAEVFEDDDTGARSFTVFGERQVPPEVIEWFLGEARTRL